MPTWPSTPIPSSVIPNSSVRETLVSGVEQGYPTLRHTWGRRQRSFTLSYTKLTTHDLYGLWDFVENDLDDGLLLFDWTMPTWNAGQINAVNGTTQLVICDFHHGLQTGDSVLVSGTPSSDGVSKVTRQTSTRFFLDDRISGTGAVGGAYQQHLPNAYIERPNGALPQPQKRHGPVKDDDGLFVLTVRILERV